MVRFANDQGPPVAGMTNDQIPMTKGMFKCFNVKRPQAVPSLVIGAWSFMNEPSPQLPSRSVLWTMRILTLVALAIGVFLLTIDVAWSIKQQTAKVPFCSAFSWLDCETVISHPRWSNWFGIPVSMAGVVVYLGMLIGLGLVDKAKSDARRGRIGWWLAAGAVAAATAALWFVGIQLLAIGKICQYCMAEHAIGLTLAFLIFVHRVGRPRRVGGAVGLGLLATAILIGGQLLHTPTYVHKQLVIGKTEGDKGYVEDAAPGDAVKLDGGAIVLDTAGHPMIGSETAKHIIVEAIDYNCPHCLHAYELMRDTLPKLGPDYAILVLTFPLNADCNPSVEETEPRFVDSCFIVELAQALWLTDPGKYAAYHDWLFENQLKISRQDALDKAHELAGISFFEANRTDGRVRKMIARDEDIVARLKVHRLPGFFAGESRFTSLPDNPDEMAKLLREAFVAP
ncbi:MAG: hypothetical protein GC162_15335 [Planctomycetes bacterium]|nr:hypothetical protein [Planctomycetota bacterium]